VAVHQETILRYEFAAAQAAFALGMTPFQTELATPFVIAAECLGFG
jgi:hypothetical protein